MTKKDWAVASVATEAAQQLRSILEDIEAGSLMASAAQRAYLTGTADTLESIAAEDRKLSG